MNLYIDELLIRISSLKFFFFFLPWWKNTFVHVFLFFFFSQELLCSLGNSRLISHQLNWHKIIYIHCPHMLNPNDLAFPWCPPNQVDNFGFWWNISTALTGIVLQFDTEMHVSIRIYHKDHRLFTLLTVRLLRGWILWILPTFPLVSTIKFVLLRSIQGRLNRD